MEAKFLIQQPMSIALLIDSLESDQMEIHARSPIEVVDRYLDTVGWEVLHSGWALRWRDVAGQKSIRLKSATMNGNAVQRRLEIAQTVEKFPRNGRRLPTGLVAETLGDIGRCKLRELFRVTNQRKRYDIRTPDGSLIEMAIDHATATSTDPPGKRARGRLEFDELELELKQGTQESLRKLADTMAQRFGWLPSRLSKFERGLQCAGLCPPPHIRPDTRSFEKLERVRQLQSRGCRKKDALSTLAYRYLIEQFQSLLLQEPRAWEGLDTEGVHQMRVAMRRIRAALRSFKHVLPADDQAKNLNGEFKWIAGVLGDVRDLDVCAENFQYDSAEVAAEDGDSLAAYRNHIAQQTQTARRQLVSCLNSPRYRQLIDSFDKYLRRGASDTARPSKRSPSIGATAKIAISKQYKKLLVDGRSIQLDSPDEALHILRIDCKRLRYLFEFFRPTYGKLLSPFIKPLTKLQNVLGEFQDACVAVQRLREYAAGVPMESKNRGELIALGQLIHHQHSLATERRRDFYEAWNQFDQAGRRSQIRSVLT